MALTTEEQAVIDKLQRNLSLVGVHCNVAYELIGVFSPYHIGELQGGRRKLMMDRVEHLANALEKKLAEGVIINKHTVDEEREFIHSLL